MRVSLPAACLAAVGLSIGACWPAPARAWGPRGHRIVARLAEAQMTPRAQAAARRLLAVRGARHLAQVATWADALRDTDPARFRATRHLHYVNFTGPDCHYDPPRECRDGDCVVGAINHWSAILADRGNPPARRAEALAFVVHFVGDVHQPLHAGYRHDAGGNRFQVRWNGKGSNLHRVWDSGLLATRHLSAAAYAQVLGAETGPVATGGTPAEWAEESCRIDRDEGVYPATHAPGAGYVARERPVAERRLRQAGARLAALLDRDLAGG